MCACRRRRGFGGVPVGGCDEVPFGESLGAVVLPLGIECLRFRLLEVAFGRCIIGLGLFDGRIEELGIDLGDDVALFYR